MATTILSALSFAIYEAPTSSLPERTTFRSFYSWVTCDTQSVCQPYASNGVLTCELLCFFLFSCSSVSRKAREMHTLAWNRWRESCLVWWELFGEVDDAISVLLMSGASGHKFSYVFSFVFDKPSLWIKWQKWLPILNLTTQMRNFRPLLIFYVTNSPP